MSLVKKELPRNENQKMVVFEKGEEVRSVERVEFDSDYYELQPLPWLGQKRMGYEVSLGYYRGFISSDALLVVTFIDINEEYVQNYEIVAQAVLMSDSYTKYMLVTRAVFLAVMVASFVAYLRKQSGTAREFEQRLVMVVSAFAILFNDPYYFVEVFRPNILSLVLSASFISVFLLAVMLSWVIMLQKIVAASRG